MDVIDDLVLSAIEAEEKRAAVESELRRNRRRLDRSLTTPFSEYAAHVQHELTRTASTEGLAELRIAISAARAMGLISAHAATGDLLEYHFAVRVGDAEISRYLARKLGLWSC